MYREQLEESAAEQLPELSAGLWERVDRVMRPAEPGIARESEQRLIKALLYRALTGATWSELPGVDAGEAAATYMQWRRSGVLTKLGQTFRIQLDGD